MTETANLPAPSWKSVAARGAGVGAVSLVTWVVGYAVSNLLVRPHDGQDIADYVMNAALVALAIGVPTGLIIGLLTGRALHLRRPFLTAVLGLAGAAALVVSGVSVTEYVPGLPVIVGVAEEVVFVVAAYAAAALLVSRGRLAATSIRTAASSTRIAATSTRAAARSSRATGTPARTAAAAPHRATRTYADAPRTYSTTRPARAAA
ncbi:hypothetical protein GCM10010435_79810 [Winogradskya consettensis]|uniref:Uncharacterized protein n=1 Tax=Winogradskya consettensis TaxID=113560 RepID=A0A919SS11_9ACTN|nr:hypothetical protein [Actinoplanes consettensis]GIM77401.1 hypothetical protein Aco04nite_55160 [Actinoplanes consettensis]